jgi:PhnB protein
LLALPELTQIHLPFDASAPVAGCPYVLDLKRKSANMAIINPHINFNGNAAEAFNFYQSVFGGTFDKIIRFKDMASPEMPIDPKEENKIMHIALPIGKYNKLIGNDVPDFLGKVNEQENRSKISVSADSRAEADKLFNGLSAAGSVEVPMTDSPWGSYFGMFRDKYGIEWIIEFDTNPNKAL